MGHFIESRKAALVHKPRTLPLREHCTISMMAALSATSLMAVFWMMVF